MKPSRLGAVLLLGALSACSSNPDCNREGCDALGRIAHDDGQSAIAGVIASESDAVANGCQECSFGTANLDFFHTTAKISDSTEAQAWIKAHAPDATLAADTAYRQLLDPGDYLVCVEQHACASAEVAAGHVVTLNIRRINGPPVFLIREYGDASLHSTPAL
jgi:hypothetical protein